MTLEQNINESLSSAFECLRSGRADLAFRLLADDVLHRKVWSHWPEDGSDPSIQSVLAMLCDVLIVAASIRRTIIELIAKQHTEKASA